MKETQIQRCPHCNSSNIGIGYQLGGGGLFADRYAYHSGARCSEIETYFCKNCGNVLLQKVKRPEIFEAAGTARGEELLEHIEKMWLSHAECAQDIAVCFLAGLQYAGPCIPD